MIYVITGPDAFLVRAAVRSIAMEYDRAGLNTSIIDAKATNLDEIVAAIGTPGFFGETRIVIVNDLMALATKGAPGDEGELSDKPAKSAVDWPRLVHAARPENVVVIVDRTLQSIPAAVKRALPPEVKHIAGDPPRGSDLVAWIKARAKSAGSAIDDADARFLAELLCPGAWSARPANPAYDRPPELDLFAGEIEKLSLAAHPGRIGRAHIETLTAAAQADRLFPLVDAVVAADAEAVIRELGHLGAVGDDVNRTIALLNQQAELLAVMVTAGQTDPVEVGRAIGLANPNRMTAIAKNLRRNHGRAKPLLDAALMTDRQLKSGELRQPVDALYAMTERVISVSRETPEGGH